MVRQREEEEVIEEMKVVEAKARAEAEADGRESSSQPLMTTRTIC